MDFKIGDFLESYLTDLKKAFSDIDAVKLSKVIESVEKVMDSGNTIHFIGNGGSAGTPSHSAGDWSKELGVATICHTDNASSLTAWANDTSYEEVFKNQLKVYLKPNDIVLAYSGSGNSENVLQGVLYANEMNCETICFTGDYNGGRGGKLAKICNNSLIFNTKSMERIEDLQLIINHVIKESIKSKRNIVSSC